jgi:hypothetical protein
MLYSSGVSIGDVEKLLPLTLGASTVTAPAFLCTVGEDSMSVSELAGLRFNKCETQGGGGGGGASEGDQHIFRVPTLTQVLQPFFCVCSPVYPYHYLSVPQISRHSFIITISRHSLSQVLGTTDASAVDSPSCILSVCRSLLELGQRPLALSLVRSIATHRLPVACHWQVKFSVNNASKFPPSFCLFTYLRARSAALKHMLP